MRSLLFLLILTGLSLKANCQANLTIENDSDRKMFVKLMEGKGKKSTLYSMVVINAHETQIVNFSKTGFYYTKMMAELEGRETVYQKGKPMKIISDSKGYTKAKLVFTIKESKIPMASGGEKITREEYELN